ncbi:uncharacterized protein JCM15063_005782 [Sporobolomyces koalae]|uniref:uncharacterized protein n=1 Tax=Sporobolomyces koalae TaxID=500713 RepID=UPI00316B0E40
MPDSLFGSDSEEDEDQYEFLDASTPLDVEDAAPTDQHPLAPRASCPSTVLGSDPRAPAPIPGLFLFPNAIPLDLQHVLTLNLSSSVWPSTSNQVMLFDSPTHSSLPNFLNPVLDLLPEILSPIPESVRKIIFDNARPRQCILNLYHPGQGIASHVDLPNRYDDAIVGISLLSPIVMDFTRAPHLNPSQVSDDDVEARNQAAAILLEPGSVYVLSGPARYDYQHGIAYRFEDTVQDTANRTEVTIRRRTRMSITLRRLLPGAEIVGPS